MKYKKICEFCGSEFTAKKSSTRFCCHRCASHAYKMKVRKENAEHVERQMGIYREKSLESNTPEIMSAQAAALYLGVHRATIYRYMKDGVLKCIQFPGKTLVRKSELDRMFEEAPGYIKRVRDISEITEFITMKETAELYDVSPAGAYKILKENKVPCQKQGSKVFYSRKHVERVFAAREARSHPEITEWYTAAQIMEIYGMTAVAVYSMAYDFCIPKKKVKRISYYSKKHVDAVKHRDEVSDDIWYTVEECMDRYALTRDQVYNYLRQHKIERSSYGKYVRFRKEDFDRIFKDRIDERDTI